MTSAHSKDHRSSVKTHCTETVSKCKKMDPKIFFVKFENSDVKGTPEGDHQDEGKTQKNSK